MQCKRAVQASFCFAPTLRDRNTLWSSIHSHTAVFITMLEGSQV